MDEQLEFDIIETDSLPFDAVQDHKDVMDILAPVADIANYGGFDDYYSGQ